MTISFLGAFPECSKPYCGGSYTPMFIVALSTITNNWNKLSCPPTDKWIMKICDRYEYHSVLKKYEITQFSRKWNWLRMYNIRWGHIISRSKESLHGLSHKWGSANKTCIYVNTRACGWRHVEKRTRKNKH